MDAARKVAVVVGGESGMGRTTAELLAEAIVKNPMLNGQTIRLDGGRRFAPR